MRELRRPAVKGVLKELSTAVGADAGCALYLDDGDGVLQLAASAGHEPGNPPSFWHRLRSNDAVRAPRTLVFNLPTDPPSVLILERRNGTDFTQQDLSLARLYMRQLVDSAPPEPDALRRSGWTQQLETIQRIAARLTRIASVDEVAAAICTETRQVIGYDEAHVLVRSDSDTGLSVVASATGSATKPAAPLPTTGAAGQALNRATYVGTPVIVAELADLGPGREGTFSMLVVPLHFEKRVSGVICLLARGANRFDDDDLRLLQILSDQAAVSIENARLLYGRDQLVHELAALLDVSEAAGRASDEVDLARTLADRMRRAAKTDAVLISRWDEGAMSLHELWRDGVPGEQPAADLTNSPIRRAVLRDGRTASVDAYGPERSAEQAQLRAMGGRSLILVPLTAGGRTIGIVELIALNEPRQLDAAAAQTVEAMATLGATGLEKVRLLEQLRSAADMDPVTGVHNHRYLQERLRQEVARSARSHSPFGVLMLDLDNFKPVNDRHGHADGDRVLHNIGAAIKDHVRTSDVVARYGGDEFVVLMPDTPPEQAELVGQRVVTGVAEGRHVMSNGSEESVGISAGLAVYPHDGRTSAALLQAADAAMYAAKRSGGRQVERSGPVAIPVESVPAGVAG
jgi:diguanylate cyclase (GGDEF)-like protein